MLVAIVAEMSQASREIIRGDTEEHRSTQIKKKMTNRAIAISFDARKGMYYVLPRPRGALEVCIFAMIRPDDAA